MLKTRKIGSRLLSCLVSMAMLLGVMFMIGVESSAADSSGYTVSMVYETRNDKRMGALVVWNQKVAGLKISLLNSNGQELTSNSINYSAIRDVKTTNVISGQKISEMPAVIKLNTNSITTSETTKKLNPRIVITLTNNATNVVKEYTLVKDGLAYNSGTKGREYKYSFDSNDVSLTSKTIKSDATTIGAGAFEGDTSLTSITIPNTVKEIKENAFKGCTGLGSITIPNSVTSIAANAFDGCTALKTVTIPSSVTSLGANAFSNTGLTSAVLDCDIAAVDTNAFEGCKLSLTINNGVVDSKNFYKTITEVKFGSNVTAIDASAFANCKEIKGELVIPGNVKSIGKAAFKNCTKITSLVLNNGVESVAQEAFMGCTSLRALTVGESVNFIGTNAFAKCSRLDAVYCSNTSSYVYTNWKSIAPNVKVSWMNLNQSSLTGSVFGSMNTTTVVILGVALLAIIAVVVVLVMRKKKSETSPE